MEVDRLRSAGNGNRAPIPMMPPGFPVTTTSDDVNLLHNWSVPKNPNLSSSSSSTFTQNSNLSFTYDNNHHLTNPNNPPPYNYSDELLAPTSSMAAMREMIFRIAALQPINIDPESVKTPKRKNVRISKDPQSVAARHRRERIGERIRILQRIVPGGMKMDTASMLDEAIHYVKFLKRQVQCLEKVRGERGYGGLGLGLGFGQAGGEQAWGYSDYMASCVEKGDVFCQQGQSSSGESYGDF